MINFVEKNTFLLRKYGFYIENKDFTWKVWFLLRKYSFYFVMFRKTPIMTSPAINGQKDASKTESTSATTEEVASRAEPEVRPTPPHIAWWRVFKLANLLMKQGC